ncbi:nuclear transport factor 2 family protein [Pseudoalteromonas sp. MMG007]|uniref:nuclear transport factor 2 family protein n=1 Tax=Pseudoalteromonas sp. MMG007 TaxID=2822684 RepID=UPI001B383CAB|nr:nuclear transport factor 2 family protein [Pseudoalteromonas sp. MMG007]MBQ4859644.1 nuclear transport factor 2 family protein [Pseudoalteromonas sp. MMG007]
MDNVLPVDKFVDIYQKLDNSNLELLSEIYSDDIQFIDPMHEINGIEKLREYFANLYSNVKHCQFDITDSFSVNDTAFIYWTMHYAHPKLSSGKTISVQGHSKLIFKDDRILKHRDYFNVGELLYKHIPLLGSVINYIDKRAG